MIKSIIKYFNERPLQAVMLLALFVRLLAVFFAKGFLMHDDHFLTIEPASSWAAGSNFNNWLPGIGNDRPHPEPISFFYLGFLALFFKMFSVLGLDNPDTQMYLIRLIQALYSLLIVYYGFKITELLSNKKNALLVGILLALIAIMPNFSVRNLVEMVCIPPLLIGYWLLLKNARITEKTTALSKLIGIPSINWKLTTILAAGFIMGLTVGVRFQTGLWVALVGLVILIQSNFKNAFIFGVVSFAAFFLTQIDDVLLWGGEPFQHLKGYFAYNTEHRNDYPGSPFAYLSFIGIFILPPVSLFLVFGFFKKFRKYLLITLPVLGFVLFHVLYPNRQERFILPALPFVVMIGVIGWNEFIAKSSFWLNRKTLLRVCWSFFWALNTIAMLVLCFTYTKKSRVESMLYLYEQHDCKNYALEFSHMEGASMMPQFYTGIWTRYYSWDKHVNIEDDIKNMAQNEAEAQHNLMQRPEPNYYVFYDDDNLEERVARIKALKPTLTYKATIEPGWFDVLLNSLNSKNMLEKMYIYKVE